MAKTRGYQGRYVPAAVERPRPLAAGKDPRGPAGLPAAVERPQADAEVTPSAGAFSAAGPLAAGKRLGGHPGARGEHATGAALAITGVAGGPVSGRSLPDAGTLGRQAPYDEAGPAADTARQPDLAHPELYGAAGPALYERAGELPSWVGRDPSPIGLGCGSYALGDAHDEGAPIATLERGIPGLRDGEYEWSARLAGLGEQGIVDGMASGAGGYALDYAPEPYQVC